MFKLISMLAKKKDFEIENFCPRYTHCKISKNLWFFDVVSDWLTGFEWFEWFEWWFGLVWFGFFWASVITLVHAWNNKKRLQNVQVPW